MKRICTDAEEEGDEDGERDVQRCGSSDLGHMVEVWQGDQDWLELKVKGEFQQGRSLNGIQNLAWSQRGSGRLVWEEVVYKISLGDVY